MTWLVLSRVCVVRRYRLTSCSSVASASGVRTISRLTRSGTWLLGTGALAADMVGGGQASGSGWQAAAGWIARAAATGSSSRATELEGGGHRRVLAMIAMLHRKRQ